MRLKLFLSVILIAFVIWIAIPKKEYHIEHCHCDLVTDKLNVIDTVYQLEKGDCMKLLQEEVDMVEKGEMPSYYVVLFSTSLYVSVK